MKRPRYIKILMFNLRRFSLKPKLSQINLSNYENYTGRSFSAKLTSYFTIHCSVCIQMYQELVCHTSRKHLKVQCDKSQQTPKEAAIDYQPLSIDWFILNQVKQQLHFHYYLKSLPHKHTFLVSTRLTVLSILMQLLLTNDTLRGSIRCPPVCKDNI